MYFLLIVWEQSQSYCAVHSAQVTLFSGTHFSVSSERLVCRALAIALAALLDILHHAKLF